MRKSLLMQMSMIFLALACSTADAAITWDADYYDFYYSVQNSGQFYYKPTNYYNPSGYAGAAEDSTYTATASATISEFAAQPGAISLTGTASGLTVPPPPVSGGLRVKASAEILPTSLTSDHGVDIAQNVVSYVTRRFRATTPWRPYNVQAALSGTVDFNSYYNSDSNHATRSVKGTVEIWEGLDDFNQDFRLIYSQALSESVRTISDYVRNLRTNADARYELKIRLTLESDLVNISLVPGSGTITIWGAVQSGNYKMSSASSPLALPCSAS